MNAEHLKDFHHLSHNDEMRYKLLMWEVKNLLHDKQQSSYLESVKRKWSKRKQKLKVEAFGWAVFQK
ncbi:hypothetical protein EBB07_02110 [Paenibacillaceae bacterium]|nr:hypothetical protein EBB07_02110 [Paenibacillaceae bacterium]